MWRRLLFALLLNWKYLIDCNKSFSHSPYYWKKKCGIDAHGSCLQICETKAERKRDNFTSSKDKKYEQMVFSWFSHNNSHVILKIFMRSIKCNYLIFILPEKRKNHEIWYCYCCVNYSDLKLHTIFPWCFIDFLLVQLQWLNETKHMVLKFLTDVFIKTG